MDHVDQILAARPVLPVDKKLFQPVVLFDVVKDMTDIAHILHGLTAADSECGIDIGSDELRLKGGNRHYKDQIQCPADDRVEDLIMAEDIIISDPKLLLQTHVLLCQGTDVLKRHLLDAAVL